MSCPSLPQHMRVSCTQVRMSSRSLSVMPNFFRNDSDSKRERTLDTSNLASARSSMATKVSARSLWVLIVLSEMLNGIYFGLPLSTSKTAWINGA